MGLDKENNMKATKEIKQELEDSIPTDIDLDFEHQKYCSDCNGHNITNWYEYRAKRKRRVHKIRVIRVSNKKLFSWRVNDRIWSFYGR
jgi:hypothetical protein